MRGYYRKIVIVFEQHFVGNLSSTLNETHVSHINQVYYFSMIQWTDQFKQANQSANSILSRSYQVSVDVSNQVNATVGLNLLNLYLSECQGFSPFLLKASLLLIAGLNMPADLQLFWRRENLYTIFTNIFTFLSAHHLQ